jgi:hypothetical protein
MNIMKKITALGSSSYLGIHPHAPCGQKDDHFPTTVVLNDSHPYVGSQNTLEVSHEPSSCTEKKKKVKRADEKETEDKIPIYLFDCRENSTIKHFEGNCCQFQQNQDENEENEGSRNIILHTHTHTHTDIFSLSVSLSLSLSLPPNPQP